MAIAPDVIATETESKIGATDFAEYQVSRMGETHQLNQTRQISAPIHWVELAVRERANPTLPSDLGRVIK